MMDKRMYRYYYYKLLREEDEKNANEDPEAKKKSMEKIAKEIYNRFDLFKKNNFNGAFDDLLKKDATKKKIEQVEKALGDNEKTKGLSEDDKKKLAKEFVEEPIKARKFLLSIFINAFQSEFSQEHISQQEKFKVDDSIVGKFVEKVKNLYQENCKNVAHNYGENFDKKLLDKLRKGRYEERVIDVDDRYVLTDLVLSAYVDSISGLYWMLEKKGIGPTKTKPQQLEQQQPEQQPKQPETGISEPSILCNIIYQYLTEDNDKVLKKVSIRFLESLVRGKFFADILNKIKDELYALFPGFKEASLKDKLMILKDGLIRMIKNPGDYKYVFGITLLIVLVILLMLSRIPIFRKMIGGFIKFITSPFRMIAKLLSYVLSEQRIYLYMTNPNYRKAHDSVIRNIDIYATYYLIL